MIKKKRYSTSMRDTKSYFKNNYVIKFIISFNIIIPKR